MEEEWGIGIFSNSEYHSTEVEADASEWVYVTVSHLEDGDYPGITNVGYKPTVGENFLGVETNLFDCDLDLYGQKCRVDFYKYIRPEQKFTSFEALKAQIRRDIESGKNWFQEEKELVKTLSFGKK